MKDNKPKKKKKKKETGGGGGGTKEKVAWKIKGRKREL